MPNQFTATTLPTAIRKLFEVNNYTVEGPIKIHGAEVDLVARPKGDPFGVPVYMEVTIEYVDNDKYGKDVGKLALIRERDPSANLLIISSAGFSLPVKERALGTRIQTLTYAELFAKFERFEPYLQQMLGEDSLLARELAVLNGIYEEPFFEDRHGTDPATAFLNEWRERSTSESRWLLVVGEYGTGKTALTRILQYRWLQEYQRDASLPIPFRIELRDFTRQFDARGLLHHFLDKHGIGHLPVEFVESLIRTGRVILLLDGYDEMAQYLHARERRACLEALAELSAEGAKGILTSRPNYFTEAEELHIFDVLYTSLKQGQYYLTAADRALLEREAQLDQLLESFLYPYERSLRDLSPDQTEALIGRALEGDPEGREVVLAVLRRVFRSNDEGAAISLSGKPVIISYLLQVVEGLKENAGEGAAEVNKLTEWQIYKLIVDQLMLRDLRRSAVIPPGDRRKFLHTLAAALSQRGVPSLSEDEFKDLVAKSFSTQLRRLPTDSRHQELERLFADLRSSTTLTRSSGDSKGAWRFSHNSLREFLLAEALIEDLRADVLPGNAVPITDAMRLFVASLSPDELRELGRKLAALWGTRLAHPSVGTLLTLLWDGLSALSSEQVASETLKVITGHSAALNGVAASRLRLSSEVQQSDFERMNCTDSELYDIDFTAASLQGADFSRSMLESVRFRNADLRSAKFSGVLAIDVDFSGADLREADFSHVLKDEISIMIEDGGAPGGIRRMSGETAIGYLVFNGAKADKIPPQMVLRHHPNYPIVEKILEKFAEQSIRQRIGIEQRGAANRDVEFAREFVDHLEASELLITPKARKDLLEATDLGRVAFNRFVETGELPAEVVRFFGLSE